MNPSSVLLRIKENILVEFIYSKEEISGSFKKYVDVNDSNQYMVNNYNMKNLTGNVETFFAVDSNVGYMAVVDVNDGFYYPNSNQNITSSQLPVGTNLKYDTIRLHIRSGYNFQDTQGFFSNLYVKNQFGKKISLLSQVAFKGDLSTFKYNNTPIRISETTFDKYVEYKVLSVSEILDGSNQTSSYFNLHFPSLSPNPIIYMDFGFVSSVDSSEGFVKFQNSTEDTIHIPSYDGFSYLQPNLVEKESYFEYSALYNGNSIENFITILNSKAGNNYHIEHEISVYEQRGFDFYEVQRHNSVQKFNYDKPLKFRPVISNLVNGSLQIDYVMRFFNSADNTSIVKRAMLNTNNISPYLEEPLRINVPIENVIKVYNKVVRKDISIDNKKSLLDNKIIVPIYYSNVAVKIDETQLLLELVPFDNVYSIYLNKETNGQDSPLELDPTVKYQMVFISSSGEKIRVIENDTTGKLKGILNFRITSEQSKMILRDSSGKFYINTSNEVVETNVCVGEWVEKGKKIKGVIDASITDAEILINEPVKVLETVSSDIQVIPVPITNENVDILTNGNGITIIKNDTQDFDLQDIPNNVVLDTVTNPVVGDVKEISVIPDGTKMPIKMFFSNLDYGYLNTMNNNQSFAQQNTNFLFNYLKLGKK
jgi:hypothetical protein